MAVKTFAATLDPDVEVVAFDLTVPAGEEWAFTLLLAEHEGDGVLVLEEVVTVPGETVEFLAQRVSSSSPLIRTPLLLVLGGGERIRWTARIVYHPDPCPLKALLSFSRRVV